MKDYVKVNIREIRYWEEQYIKPWKLVKFTDNYKSLDIGTGIIRGVPNTLALTTETITEQGLKQSFCRAKNENFQ